MLRGRSISHAHTRAFHFSWWCTGSCTRGCFGKWKPSEKDSNPYSLRRNWDYSSQRSSRRCSADTRKPADCGTSRPSRNAAGPTTATRPTPAPFVSSSKSCLSITARSSGSSFSSSPARHACPLEVWHQIFIYPFLCFIQRERFTLRFSISSRFQKLDTPINDSTQNLRSVDEDGRFSTIRNDLRQLPKTAWLYHFGDNAGEITDSCARRSTLVPPLLETNGTSTRHIFPFHTYIIDNYPNLI